MTIDVEGPATFQPFRRTGAAGETCTVGKTLTDADISLSAGISGNLHPLYVDRSFAVEQGLPERLVYELTAASLCVTAASEIVGPNMRLSATEFRFLKPAPVGTTLRASATISSRNAGSVLFSAALVDTATGEDVAQGTLTFTRATN